MYFNRGTIKKVGRATGARRARANRRERRKEGRRERTRVAATVIYAAREEGSHAGVLHCRFHYLSSAA